MHASLGAYALGRGFGWFSTRLARKALPLRKARQGFYFSPTLAAQAKPLSATIAENTSGVARTLDGRPPQRCGDPTYIYCIFEALMLAARRKGLSDRQSEHIGVVLRWQLMRMVLHDMEAVSEITPSDRTLVQMAGRRLAVLAGKEAAFEENCSLSVAQLQHVHLLVQAVSAKADVLAPSSAPTLRLESTKVLRREQCARRYCASD